MDNRVIAVVTIFYLLVSSNTLVVKRNADDIVILNSPKEELFNEGDTILFDCSKPDWDVEKREGGKWKKQSVTGFLNGSNDNPVTTGISINRNVIDGTDTRRYKAAGELKEKDFHFTLTIEDAKASDSGLYTCTILSETKPSQSKLITVVSDIDELVWRIAEVDEGVVKMEVYKHESEELLVKEGDTLNLSCMAQRGFPQPLMQVYTIPDDPSLPDPKPTYLTSLFNLSLHQDPQHLTFDSSLVPATPLLASFSLHNMKLVCSGKVEGMEAKTAGISVVLTEYKPHFVCPKKPKVKLGTANFSITCIVHAKPGVTESKVFLVDAKNKHQLVGDGQSEKEYTMIVENVDSDEELLNITLVIAEVKRAHLIQYEFICESELGETKHHITLEEENGPKAEKASSSTPPSHLFHFSSLSTILLPVISYTLF